MWDDKVVNHLGKYSMPEEYDDGPDYSSLVWIYINWILSLIYWSEKNEGSIKIDFVCMQ